MFVVQLVLLSAATQGAPLVIDLEDALARARANAPQLLSANINTLLAREDAAQAKASLLPGVNGLSQYIYTQANGYPSGVFVSNDGPHIYNNQLQVHGDIYAPAKLADLRRARLSEEVAKARAEIAARGLYAIVAQNYYGMLAAARKLANAQQSEKEAGQFLDITRKQEAGGEAAHSDTVKAEIQSVQRRRDSQEAQLALDKSRLGFAILLFPDFRQDFTLADDLEKAGELPPLDQLRAMAGRNNPDVRAAQAAVDQFGFEMKAARAASLPSISFDYYWGMNSPFFAAHTPEGYLNLGSVAEAQMTIPLWTWGANRSRVKQAELRREQARTELRFTQRELLSNLESFYLEANLARDQIATLRRSEQLAADSLKLTVLRYEAGEASVLEVVDAQSTVAQARNAFADGLARYRVGLANLQTLTGVF